MNRFQFITRATILALWGLGFLYFLVAPYWPARAYTTNWEVVVEVDPNSGAYGVGEGDAEGDPRWVGYKCFFCSPGGVMAALAAFGVCAVLGRRALAQAFRELSYPQFSLLTLVAAGALFCLADDRLFDVLLPAAMNDRIYHLPPHKLAYLAGLNLLTVAVPSALAVVILGWPWRWVERSGLVSATCACLAYVLWNYFLAAAMWRG